MKSSIQFENLFSNLLLYNFNHIAEMKRSILLSNLLLNSLVYITLHLMNISICE